MRYVCRHVYNCILMQTITFYGLRLICNSQTISTLQDAGSVVETIKKLLQMEFIQLEFVQEEMNDKLNELKIEKLEFDRDFESEQKKVIT